MGSCSGCTFSYNTFLQVCVLCISGIQGSEAPSQKAETQRPGRREIARKIANYGAVLKYAMTLPSKDNAQILSSCAKVRFQRDARGVIVFRRSRHKLKISKRIRCVQ